MNSIKTLQAGAAQPGQTLYEFLLMVEWKGQGGDAILVATSKDDACDFFYANSRAISGFPKSALRSVHYLGQTRA